MNTNDGRTSSSSESSNEDKKNTKENIENTDEDSEEKVVANSVTTDCDVKPIEGSKYLSQLYQTQTNKEY